MSILGFVGTIIFMALVLIVSYVPIMSRTVILNRTDGGFGMVLDWDRVIEVSESWSDNLFQTIDH